MENKNSDRASAVLAGERALRTMDRAREGFGAASRYGFWEMFGGGFLAGGRKSVQTVEAKNTMGKVRDAVIDFKELLDEQWVSGEQWIDLCEFVRFCEDFVEQPIADWRARSRIDDARIQVDIAKERLRKMVAQLK